MLIKNSLLLILLLLFFNLARAELRQEAEKAVQLKNYSIAVEKYKQLAEKNDPEAYLQLGKLYFENGSAAGLSITEDEAINWLTKASEASQAEAFYMLGIMFKNRQYKAEDVFTFLIQGAKLGSANAQESVARAYQNGEGVVRDLKKAFQWNLKAAAGGNRMALGQVIFAYANGYGVEPDDIKVVYWQGKALEMGDQSERYCLAARYEAGIGVKKDISKAIDLYAKFEGNEMLYTMDADLALGTLYYTGVGIKKDLKLAKKYFKKSRIDENLKDEEKILEHYSELNLNLAISCSFEENAKKQFESWLIDKKAALGDGFALWQLAYANEAKDPAKALELYRQAAAKGDKLALETMGVLYENGRLVQKNEQISRDWYRKYMETASASKLTNKARDYYFRGEYDKALFWLENYKVKEIPEAQWLLGETYLVNERTKYRSVEPLMYAANAGHMSAQYTLGKLYFGGDGVVKNLQIAFDLYLKSANQGFSPSQYMVAVYYQEGLIQPIDKSKSYFWSLLSAADGNLGAKKLVATIEKDLPKNIMLEIQKFAIEWKPVKKYTFDPFQDEQRF